MRFESTIQFERVLVVDDHAISRQFTLSALQHCDCRIRQTGTAEGALNTALSWLPQAIITDLWLPDYSGQELAKRILDQWPENASQPLLVLLTGDSKARRSRANLMLFDQVLIKPVAEGALCKALHRTTLPYVREKYAPENDPALWTLFRQELEQSLLELDGCISTLRTDSASRLLHKLIASSVLLGEKPLEVKLRTLHRSCSPGARPENLAHAYLDFRRYCRSYFVQLGTAN